MIFEIHPDTRILDRVNAQNGARIGQEMRCTIRVLKTRPFSGVFTAQEQKVKMGGPLFQVMAESYSLGRRQIQLKPLEVDGIGPAFGFTECGFGCGAEIEYALPSFVVPFRLPGSTPHVFPPAGYRPIDIPRRCRRLSPVELPCTKCGDRESCFPRGRKLIHDDPANSPCENIPRPAHVLLFAECSYEGVYQGSSCRFVVGHDIAFASSRRALNSRGKASSQPWNPRPASALRPCLSEQAKRNENQQ